MPTHIPHVLTVDAIFWLHLWMIHHDNEHRYFTWQRFGHEPTNVELSQHWFERGAESFEKTLVQTLRTQHG